MSCASPIGCARPSGSWPSGRAVDPSATGRENVELQGRFFGLSGRERSRQRVEELLALVELTDDAGRSAGTYSGGMARRLDIAIGLVHRPGVLFLDEPTTGLDPEARADAVGRDRRLAAGEGLTVLLTTHYLEEADRLADRRGDPGPWPDRRDRHARFAQGRAARRRDRHRAARPGRGARHPVRPVEPARRRASSGSTTGWSTSGSRPVRPRCRASSACSMPGGSPWPRPPSPRPSLDDVYLRHTGRSFASAERTLEGAIR